MLAVQKRSSRPSGVCPTETLLVIEPIERDSQPDGLMLLVAAARAGSYTKWLADISDLVAKVGLDGAGRGKDKCTDVGAEAKREPA